MSELGHIVGRPFKPGQSGNPSGLPGRPLGSRTAFSQGFLDDLAKTWRDKGRQTMEWTADIQPATFFAVCARLIGPEVKLTIEQSLPGNLSGQDWAIMREIVDAVKTAVPDAANRPAGQVLEYVPLSSPTDRITFKKRIVLFAPAKFANDLRGPFYN
jgi:hypothetical protein